MDAKWYRQLGGRIARLRGKAGLTQEDLAERASIAPSYVARIETGTRHPTLDVLGKIAGALDVPIQRLIADERAVRAAESPEPWGRPARGLTTAMVELDDADIDLLLRVANRLKQR